jgi:hypothetical protein
VTSLMRTASIAIGVGLVSTLIFLWGSHPFLWLFGLWGLYFCGWVVKSTKRPVKLLCLNLGLIFVLLFSIETVAVLWNSFSGHGSHVRRYDKDHQRRHPFLGYAPKPNFPYRVYFKRNGEMVYDVTYTIDEHGLRITPKPREQDAPAVLFFGGSYTLGEGVHDEEAMPYLVGKATGYRVLNFGDHGYGPHQMLSALQNEFPETVLGESRPAVVIYLAIGNHAKRCAGLAPWDDTGPRYVLDAQGRPIQKGTFERPNSLLFRMNRVLQRRLATSVIGKRLVGTKPSEIDLWAGIVAESKREVERRWPRAEFHVLFHSRDKSQRGPFQRGLEALNIKAHWLQDLVPELNDDDARIPYDGHPSAKAQKLMAEYVLDNILPEEKGPGF